MLLVTATKIIIKIQSYLEKMFRTAQARSSLHYLRALVSAHSLTGTLVKRLSEIKILKEDQTNAKLSEVASGFLSILERCKEDLFVQYIEGGRYLQKESESLTEICDQALSPFMKFLVCP
jgi:uncharacterized protein (UPF0305 family)